jgi:nucleotide-binding universal stress UspA family protein
MAIPAPAPTGQLRPRQIVHAADAIATRVAKDYLSMAAKAIISYDGTANDDDALALGNMLSRAGLKLELAYVRHAREFDPRREELAQHDAEQRLERGASSLGDPGVTRHVVFGASTGERLGHLAASEGASLIVFGSDYRTTPGHVEPGNSAQHLLDGGSVAVAIAPAGLRTRFGAAISSIAVPLAGPWNEVARETAAALARKLGAMVANSPGEQVDLIVVGSQPGAPSGHIAVGGDVRSELNNARCSVLILPAGAPLLP